MTSIVNILSSRRSEMIDITEEVQRIVSERGVPEGIALVYTPHTTSGITINENADPSVPEDITMKLVKMINQGDPDYRHAEGNSDSHVKSSVIGVSEEIIIDEGHLMLGRWQGIFFVEFDGPRSRNVFVKIISGR